MPQSPDKPSKHLGVMMLCAGYLAIPAFLFALIGDAPHVLAITLAGLALSLMLLRRPLPRTARSYVYAGVIVATLSVFQNQMFTMEADRFFLLPAEIYCPALLFLGVALTFFDHRESTLSAIIGAGLVATMLTGNTLGANEPNSRFPVGGLLLDELTLTYLAAAAVQMAFLLPLLPYAIQRRRQPSPGRRYLARRGAVYAAALVLVAGGAWGLRTAAVRTAPRLQTVLQRFFSDYFHFRTSRIIFAKEVDLWRTVDIKAGEAETIMLRATAPGPPGYLRGRAYFSYGNGKWRVVNGSVPMNAREPEEGVASLVYTRPAWPGRAESEAVNIYPAAEFRSDVLLVPGNAGSFELVADDLATNREGVLLPDEWDEGGGYSAYLQERDFQASYPRPLPTGDTAADYTALPDDIETDVRRLAEEIFAPSSETARAQIQDLQAYYAAGFEYELGVEHRDKTDPVLAFLENNRRGHCELFAAASALLLRAKGIPTRYVTGFVCAEPHPYGDYWIARLADAHAWVEAFLPEERRWIVVETTPASGIPGDKQEFGWFSALVDRITLFWRSLLADLKRGYVARVILRLITGALRAAWALVADPLRAVLVGLALLALATALWYRERLRISEEEKHLPPTVRELRQVLRRLEKRLRKKGLQRDRTATLREFAAQIDETSTEDAERYRELLREYEILRYTAEPPPQDVVKSFARHARRP